MDYWKIKFEPLAEKQLNKIDKTTTKSIQIYINSRLINDPRSKGKALTGNKRGLWRYRVGKYRIVCRIKDNILTVVVITIAKRDVVYDN